MGLPQLFLTFSFFTLQSSIIKSLRVLRTLFLFDFSLFFCYNIYIKSYIKKPNSRPLKNLPQNLLSKKIVYKKHYKIYQNSYEIQHFIFNFSSKRVDIRLENFSVKISRLLMFFIKFLMIFLSSPRTYFPIAELQFSTSARPSLLYFREVSSLFSYISTPTSLFYIFRPKWSKKFFPKPADKKILYKFHIKNHYILARLSFSFLIFSPDG